MLGDEAIEESQKRRPHVLESPVLDDARPHPVQLRVVRDGDVAPRAVEPDKVAPLK